MNGTTTLLSYSSPDGEAGNFVSEAPVFTGNGDTIVLQSFASDLATNDFNVGGDLFILQLSATNSLPDSTNSSLFCISQLICPSGTSTSGSQNPTLTWPTAAGTTYQVWFKDNLTDPVWQPLNGSVTVVGNQAQAVDFAPNAGHRFYRIQAH